jgi:AbiV family abortive infection protein
MIFFQWGVKAADNAVSLAAESRLLFEVGYLPRAYYLAHMSTEESSKSILLHVMCVMRTPESEVRKVSALLRDHKKKIEFLVTYAATMIEDLSAAIDELQLSLIDHMNDLKNDTMYVSYKGGVVVAPEDKIAPIKVDRYTTFAEKLAHFSKNLQDRNQPGISDLNML